MRENIALSKVARWEIGKSYAQLRQMAIRQVIPAWRQDGRWMINKQQLLNHVKNWQ